MTDVFLSFFLVLIVSVGPFLFFLAVINWNKGSVGVEQSGVCAIDAEATWRRAVAGLIYHGVFLIVVSALTSLLWNKFGAFYPGVVPVGVVVAMYFFVAVFKLLVAADQTRLGWPRAQSTWWARHLLRGALPPKDKIKQTPNAFGENGAVLK